MTNKLSNGMYKTTSKVQDKISIAIFKVLGTDSMSTNFNQTTGHAYFTYQLTDGNTRCIILDYKGNMI
jgi:hypothetical protein